MKKHKVLFISPYGSKNGAETMLNNVIEKIKGDIEPVAYFGQRGNLIPDVSIPVHTGNPNKVSSIVNRIKDKFVRRERNVQWYDLLRLEKKYQFDVWYINTVHMLWAVELAKLLEKRIIIHFHDYLFQYQLIGYKELESAINYAETTIGCSASITEALQVMGAKSAVTINECVNFNTIDKEIRNCNIDVHQEFKIPKDKPFWIMSGSFNVRKGIDLVLEVARTLRDQYNFVVIGPGNSGFRFYLEKLVERDKLSNIFLLKPNNLFYYPLIDASCGFFLSSREDPFPLVMIEAAYLGKPIVGFDSGGIKEFLVSGMGEVASKIDPDAIVKIIQEFNWEDFDPAISRKRALEFDGAIQSKEALNLILNEKYPISNYDC